MSIRHMGGRRDDGALPVAMRGGSLRGTVARSRRVIAILLASALAVLGSSPAALAAESVRFRGAVEVTAHHYDEDALRLNVYNRSDSPFDLLRFRFFVEAAPTEKLQVLTQLRFDDALSSDFVVAGAYLLYEMVPEGALFVEAGKIPSPFGVFAERDYWNKSALIGTPLMYYYHSALLSRVVPANEDDLLSVRGRGQFGISYPSIPASPFRGSPILYTPCWDYGMVLLGSRGDFEYRFGMIGGSPGVPLSAAEETNELPSAIGRLGWAPVAGLRFGASGSAGPYLPKNVEGHGDPFGSSGNGQALPEGRDAEDYLQVLWGGDFELSFGQWSLWSEAVHNYYQSPWLRSDLIQDAFYVELQRGIVPGLDAAVRWCQIRPHTIRNAAGNSVRWDVPVQRVEAGAVYHVSREFLIKGNVQMTGFGLRASSIGDEVLTSLQLVGSF